MKKLSTFQLIVTIAFAVFAAAGVFLFAIQKGDGANQAVVTIWGTVDSRFFSSLVENTFGQKDAKNIIYKEINENDFDKEFVEALAEDRGPDAIILKQDKILQHEGKIFPIPYKSLSERSFRDNFVDGADIFLRNDGILGLPFMVDPMVMYWNRSTFAGVGLSGPPMYWDEFSAIIPKITKSDFSSNISKSAVSLGEFNNITNAKDIFFGMLFQLNMPIITRSGDMLRNISKNKSSVGIIPTETVLRFFTEFADPVKPTYYWNRSLPRSKDMFLSGDLATYFGFASELEGIREKNPNLDFDVAMFPQIRDSERKATFANFEAFSILKKSKNLQATIIAISKLSNKGSISFISENTNLPPVNRKLLKDKPTDPYKSIFYDSALISKAWLDPNNNGTDGIFAQMIRDVTSGKLRISESVNKASDLLDILIQ